MGPGTLVPYWLQTAIEYTAGVIRCYIRANRGGISALSRSQKLQLFHRYGNDIFRNLIGDVGHRGGVRHRCPLDQVS
jgi:hypothetical protein